MKKQTIETLKKVGAIAGVVAIAGLGVLGGSHFFPKTITQEVIVDHVVTETVTETVTVEVPVEVEKVVYQNVSVEVPVEDLTFVQLACDRLVFDDVAECKEEVIAEDAALKLALDKLEDESFVFDMLEDEGIIVDEDEANVVKVYSDFEDIEIVSDFKNDKYEFKISMKVEDEDADVKKKVEFTVKVEDSEVDVTSVSEI